MNSTTGLASPARPSLAIPRHASPPAVQRRSLIDLHWLVLLALPMLLLGINPSWAVNPTNQIDAWVYYGYMRDLPRYLTDWFPGLYYGTRLPLILPGFAAHSVLPPMAAHYASHLLFYWVAVLSLYSVLRDVLDRRAAMFGALLFGCHSLLLGAVGWDYTDGPLIAYYLLSLALLSRAAARERPRATLLGAGAAFAAMLYVNPTLVLFAPTFPLWFAYRDRQRVGITRWDALRAAAVWFMTGGVLLTIALCVANASLGGELWFYGPSIRFARSFIGAQNPWRSVDFAWVREKPWLPFPALGLVATLLYLLRAGVTRRIGNDASGAARTASNEARPAHHAIESDPVRRDPGVFFGLNYVYTAGVWWTMEMTGHPVLQHVFYANLLLPALFLAIAAQFGVLPERIRGRTAWVLGVLLLAALVAPLAPQADALLTRASAACGYDNSLPLRNYALLAAAVALAWRALRPRAAAALAAFALTFCTAHALVRPTHDAWFGMDLRPVLELVNRGRHVIDLTSGGLRPRLWYSEKSPHSYAFVAVSATYLYRYSMLSFEYPRLSHADFVAAQLTTDTPVYILAEERGIDPEAAAVLAAHGWRVRSTEPYEIASGPHGFWITKLELEEWLGQPVVARTLSPQTPRLLEQVDAVEAVALPFGDWRPAGAPGVVRFDSVGDRTRIVTDDKRWNWAALYAPLVSPAGGEFYFRLRVREVDGGLAFGLVDEQQRGWIVQAPEPRVESGMWVYTFRIRLAPGQVVIPLITNNHPVRDQKSSFIVLDMCVFEDAGGESAMED
ncbi:MAG: glycosyltransferase family 39 protein [Phycisphaerae bacterium]